ncbi:dCMP deaminase family protein [bacterium]|nr:dCMP deaminase family protein [bacterium]
MHKDLIPFEPMVIADSELVIGLVGAVGSEINVIRDCLKNELETYGYDVNIIKVSNDIIDMIRGESMRKGLKEFTRITRYMDAGDELRKKSKLHDILALGIALKIQEIRDKNRIIKDKNQRVAYLIESLKHPNEVVTLRHIYSSGFWLVGVFADSISRERYLKSKGVKDSDLKLLFDRDENENVPYGQKTRDTFHLSDFFIQVSSNRNRIQNEVSRFIDLLFGFPYHTPTFDEFAMYMAFISALRSADLSRQVGAVITINDEIISTGANDVPKYGGGLYWPHLDSSGSIIKDDEGGRDYTKGVDSNKKISLGIADNIIKNTGFKGDDKDKLKEVLSNSELMDITEYGRAVHAEMEAIVSCTRKSISCKGGTLYSTTFPCHNCAKHIIAAGIKRVVFVEPYPKSKALELHSDAITLEATNGSKIVFESFTGIGPRRFLDLFSMTLGSGYPVKRKIGINTIVPVAKVKTQLRMQLDKKSYLDREKHFINQLGNKINIIRSTNDK